MRRRRLMAMRPFRPLARVLAPAAAARGPDRFPALALVFRRSRPGTCTAPAPTLVASARARVTIAPRLQWHLHRHHHLHRDLHRYQHRHHAWGLRRHQILREDGDLHQHSCLQVAQLVREPSAAPARAGSVVHGRVLGADVRWRVQAAGTIRLTGSASRTASGIERLLPPHRSGSRLPSPAQSLTTGTPVDRDPNPRPPMRPLAPAPPGAVGPSPHAARAPASAWTIRSRALVVRSYSSGGQPAAARRLARAGRSVSERRAVPEAGALVAAAGRGRSTASTLVEPEGGATPVSVALHRRIFGRSPRSGPHNAANDTSRLMRRSPDPDHGQALLPPALISFRAFAPIANRVADRVRSILGQRSPGAGRSETSSPSGDLGISTVVQVLATRQRDAERRVSPTPITFRRTATAQADRPAPPPARAASAPPPIRVDVDRLSDEVIRRIERRSRIERERRGLL